LTGAVTRLFRPARLPQPTQGSVQRGDGWQVFIGVVAVRDITGAGGAQIEGPPGPGGGERWRWAVHGRPSSRDVGSGTGGHIVETAEAAQQDGERTTAVIGAEKVFPAKHELAEVAQPGEQALDIGRRCSAMSA